MKSSFHVGPNTQPGIGPFLFLGIILAVMIGGLIYTSSVGKQRDDKVEVQDKGSNPEGITFVRTDFDPKVETWGNINDQRLEGQQDVPVNAFKKASDIVAARSWQRMRSAGNVINKEVQGFITLDVEAAFSEPHLIRGLPVEVLGTLQEIEDFDLFDAYTHKLPDGRYKVKRGSMISRKGKHKSETLVHFTLLDEVTEDAPILVPGAQIKLQGVFFKLHRFDSPDGPVTGIWILAKRALKSYRLPQGDEIDLDTLGTVRDAVKAIDAERDPLEEPPLFHLLGSVYDGQKILTEKIEKMDGKKLRLLLTEPADHRGKSIDFGARVMRVDHHTMDYWFPEHDLEDNPIDEFWITYVTPDDNTVMTVIWLKEPPKNLKKRDQVRMKGVFYRVWGLKSKRTSRGRSPLLVGFGEIDVFTVEPKTGLDDPVTLGLIFFSVLVLVLVIIVLWFDRRRAALFSDTLSAKKKLQRRTGKLARKAPEDPSTADEPS